MERNELANEIIDFSLVYRLFDNPENMKSENIVQHLEESWFVEHLIHVLNVKAKYIKSMDNNRLKRLLIELERVRLDLEYPE